MARGSSAAYTMLNAETVVPIPIARKNCGQREAGMATELPKGEPDVL
jgi:hypothetical protein